MSAAQSAHYLVDKDGKMHPADVWSLVESSNPTRIDRWEIPTRWRVQYRPCPTVEGMTYWAVLGPGAVMPVARFRTWREALVEADRLARTREVVLPRPSADGYITTADEQIALEGTGYDHNTRTRAWVEEPDTIGLAIGDCDHYMTTEGAHSIALALAALAALAEQERSCEK